MLLFSMCCLFIFSAKNLFEFHKVYKNSYLFSSQKLEKGGLWCINKLYMNPENRGSHIDDHHSLLWRKKMFEWEPKMGSRQICHLQLNEMGSTGQGWRYRNNTVQTNYPRSRTAQRRRRQEQQETPGFDEETLQKSRKLIKEMERTKIVVDPARSQLSVVKYPYWRGNMSIYNDYHSSVANPGFSRNLKGTFYTR